MAEPAARRDLSRRPTARRYALWAAATAVVIVVVSIGAVAVLAKRVEGQSMMPTLRNGDRILTHPFTSGSARRFDIVELHAPDQDGTVVKRVIGVPGDAVTIRGLGTSSAQVLVRVHDQGPWMQVENTAWRGQWMQPTPCCSADGVRTGGPHVVVIPRDRYFVLGDNPDVSVDSRMFGWVPATSIVARVWIRVWPLSSAGAPGSTAELAPLRAGSPPG